MDRSVSIVGKSPGYEKVFDTEDSIIWVVSSVFKNPKIQPEKVGLIFNMHKPEIFEDWLPKESRRAITAFGPYQRYPVDYMFKKYGPVFGSSITWMIALAIEHGYKEINIFGCEMATQKEYIDQRDTFFYMVGRAEALGIKVNIPEGSRVFFKDRMYGVI